MDTRRGAAASVNPFLSTRWRAAVTVAAASFASGLAFHLYSTLTWPLFALGWVAMVPWLAAIDRISSWRGTLAAGWLMSCAFATAILPWFPALVADYGDYSYVTGTFVFLTVAPLLQPQFILMAAARYAARRAPRRAVRAVAAAGAYVGSEWLLAKTMGDTLAHAQLPALWLSQSADLFGAHGITFVMVLFNEAVLAVVGAAPWRRSHHAPRPLREIGVPLIYCVITLAALNLYGALRLARIDGERGRPPLRVAAVQANLGHYDRLRREVGTFEAVRHILDTHFEMSLQAIEAYAPDLLLWPETVYPTTFGAAKSEDGEAFDRAIAAFVRQHGVPLIFGAFDRDGDGEYNAAFHLEPNHNAATYDVYRKMRPFPFTEYLPAALERPWLRRLLPWAGTWRPGTEIGAFALRYGQHTAAATPLICYDAIDPRIAIEAVRGGSELLVTLSNDSWFPYRGARELILAVSAFRSIETRRPQVRSTPTGISAVVDAGGRLVYVADADQKRLMVAEVAPRAAPGTLMVAWGDWLPPSALLVALLCVLWAQRGLHAGQGNAGGSARARR